MTLSPDSRRRLPKFPFWKDERSLLTGLTTSQAVRLFIVTVLIGFTGMGMVGFYLVDISDNQSSYSTETRAIIAHNKKARLEDQARTDRLIAANKRETDQAIRDLACFAVSVEPSGKSRVLDQLRYKYGCPAYRKGANIRLNPFPQISPGAQLPPGGVQRSSAPGPGVSSIPQTTPAPTRTAPSPARSSVPVPASTSSQQRPTSSPRPTSLVSSILCTIVACH